MRRAQRWLAGGCVVIGRRDGLIHDTLACQVLRPTKALACRATTGERALRRPTPAQPRPLSHARSAVPAQPRGSAVLGAAPGRAGALADPTHHARQLEPGLETDAQHHPEQEEPSAGVAP